MDSLSTWGSKSNLNPWKFEVAPENIVISQVPYKNSLHQNYPNPFNSATKIEYSLEKQSQISISIYDINGRRLETLVNKKQNAGKYTIDFNSKNYSSGVYFCEFLINEALADEKREVKKMMILK